MVASTEVQPYSGCVKTTCGQGTSAVFVKGLKIVLGDHYFKETRSDGLTE